MPKRTSKKAKSEATEPTDNKAASKIITGKVRATFVKLLEPDSEQFGGKYSITIIIPKSDKKTVKAIQGAIAAALDYGKNSEAGKLKGVKDNKISMPLKDGESEFDVEQFPEYEDSYVLTLKTDKKPKVIDRKRQILDDTDDVYSGMYVAVTGSAYPYKVPGNAGISFILGAVCKLEDGEPLGGGGASFSENDFDEYLEDDEDEDELTTADEDEEDEDGEEDELDFKNLKKLIKKAKKIKGFKKAWAGILEDYDLEDLEDIEDEDDLEEIETEIEEWIEDNE